MNKKHKKLAIIISIAAVLCILLGGLFFYRGMPSQIKAAIKSNVTYSFPRNNIFGLSKIYVGDDFVTVVVGTFKMNSHDSRFRKRMGYREVGDGSSMSFAPSITFPGNGNYLSPESVSIYRSGFKYVITATYPYTSIDSDVASAWYLGPFKIDEFEAPTLSFSEMGGEWGQTTSQTYASKLHRFNDVVVEEQFYPLTNGGE